MSSQTSTGITLKSLPSSSRTSRNRSVRVQPEQEVAPVRVFLNPQNRSESTLLGIRLINCIRNGKVVEASQLIEKDTNIYCSDEAGWSALHHAACGGYVDLIIALIKKGENIDVLDKSEETPLHKSSRRGHTEAIAVLIAFGADISAVNENGHNPLEVAVQALKVPSVEALCILGAEVMLQDWSWTMEELNSRQKQVFDILLRQHSRSSGFKHRCIVSDVVYIEPGGEHRLKSTDLDVKTDDVTESYFLYCCKMKMEYFDMKANLKDENEVVSDVYELRLWRYNRKILKAKLRINLVLMKNEKLALMSPSEKCGRVEHVDAFAESADSTYHYSDVTLTLNIRKSYLAFCLVKIVQPEKFSITKDGIVLKPQYEPETEISIPKDTFESEGELSLQIVDTKEVNNEEKEGDVLMTSIVDISMTDGQQPKHEIKMKIPIHHKISVNDEVVILATSSEAPSSIDDWEVMEAEMDETGKSASFKIKHFSIYAGSTKEKVKIDLPGVVSALERSINKQKKIEFFLMTKWVNIDTLLLVVEAAVPRKIDTRIKNWSKLGYNESSLRKSEECNVKNGQRCIFTFSGNIQEVSGEESFPIIFQNNRENFRVFNMCLENEDIECAGTIDIYLENEVKREVFLKKSGAFTCCSPIRVKTEVKMETEKFQSMDFEIIQPKEKTKETDGNSDSVVFNQTMNKLGLFKYKVNAIKHKI